MAALLSILREVNDPRDFNARHELGMILFVALSATLCGAKSCVDIADFAAGRAEELQIKVAAEPRSAGRHQKCFLISRLLCSVNHFSYRSRPQALCQPVHFLLTLPVADI